MIQNSLVLGRNNLLNSFQVTNDPISYLMTIDVNPTELCNRTCEFCPRSDANVYPNQNLHMSSVTAKKFAEQLGEIDYKNQIHFGGQCEPLLTKEFNKIVATFKESIPTNNNFHLTTNGDHLDNTVLTDLIACGINHINVSCYDSLEQTYDFEKMLAGRISYTIKHFYKSSSNKWGFPGVSNRAGMLFKIKQPLNQPCHLPFYSTSIDWNGNVYLCVHDWNKHKILGNIHYRHIKDIWCSDTVTSYRKMLIEGKRTCDPCNGCDVDGRYYGQRNFNFFKEIYE